MTTNEMRQLRAKVAGAVTFRYDSVERWRGCTDCGQAIRSTVTFPGRPGLHRGCDCPGRVWTQDPVTGTWTRADDG